MKYAKKTYVSALYDNPDLPEWPLQPGMRVVFSRPEAGYPKSHVEGLVLNEIYTLKEVRVDRFISYVELEEVPGSFNSTHFQKPIEIIEEMHKRLLEESKKLDPELQELVLRNIWTLAKR